MPIPKVVARINRWLINPLSRRFAGRVRPFAIVVHTGRRSGREYRTPIMAFPSPDGFVIALTYGRETDWVRNVLTSGGCAIEYRRHTIPLTDPRLGRGIEGRQSLPRAIWLALRLLRVDDFLFLKRTGD